MKNVSILPALFLAATAMVATSACENTREGMERDSEIAAERAEQAGDRASDEAAEAAREAEPAARDAGDAVADGAESAATAIEVSTTTAQVKAALMADRTVDASNIDVDTNGERRTVTLRGSVKSAAQKTEAERIARDKAEGFKIVNDLTIAG